MSEDKSKTEVNYANQFTNNREIIQKNEECACFNCLKKFNSSSINEWTEDGKTALCPSCKVESVIPKTSEVNNKLLKILQFIWLTPIMFEEVKDYNTKN